MSGTDYKLWNAPKGVPMSDGRRDFGEFGKEWTRPIISREGVPMPRSEAFLRGHDAALKAWEEAGGPIPWDGKNPFAIGSEEEIGWEDFVYTINQK